MKTKLIFVFLLSCFILLPSASPQGLLTPPGAPAPTMKTLTQVEPRTPINQASLPFTINASGSYYVTENLSVASGNAITIAGNGVTLDLSGFTITSTSATAAGTAVQLNSGLHDISILNGHIVGGVTYNGTSFSTGPGFQNGIAATGASPGNVRVSGVSVAGCSGTGINLGTEFSDVVDHCTVRVAGGVGIQAGVVSDSIAYQCGDNGIVARTATGCYSTTTASARGVYTTTALSCYGLSVGGTGVEAISASDCYGASNSSYGIYATTANNCYGISSVGGSYGLFATTATNCYGNSGSGGTGLRGYAAATNCYGFSATGTGLDAYLAIGCLGETTTGTPVIYNYHYNMPPNNYPTP